MLWNAFQLCLSIIFQTFGCLEHIFYFPLFLCLVPGLRHGFWEGPAFPMKPRLNGLKLFSYPASTSCLLRVSVLSSHTHLGPWFWFSHPSPYPLPVTQRTPSDLHLPGPFRVTRQLPLFFLFSLQRKLSLRGNVQCLQFVDSRLRHWSQTYQSYDLFFSTIILFYSFIHLFVCLFWVGVALGSPGWPRIHYPLASTS